LYGDDYDQFLARQQQAGPRQVWINTPEETREDNRYVTDILTWTLSEQLTLKNLAHYSKYRRPVSLVDFDSSPRSALEVDSGAASSVARVNELQVLGESPDGNANFVLGLYREDVNSRSAQYTYQVQDAFTPGGDSLAATQYQPTTIHELSKAIFGQATFRLSGAMEGLGVTLGARRTWDKRSTSRQPLVSRAATAYQFVCQIPVEPGDPCLSDAEGRWNESTWTLGLDYRLDPDTLWYLTSRKGYKAGGFNVFAPTPEDIVFEPETVRDVELGVKADWVLGSLSGRSNLALYHAEFDNIQRADAFFLGGDYKTLVTNVARAEIGGVEAEIALVPRDNLRLDIFYSWTRPSYLRYLNRLGQDLSDKPFPRAPEHQAGASVSYRAVISESGASVTFRADWFWQDRFFTNPIDGQTLSESRVAPYALANGRVEYENPRFGVDLAFFVTNLMNRDFVQGVNSAGDTLGFTSVNYGAPRQWGLELHYEF
jgi:iron complex outermembrane receptor protein